MAFKVFDRVRDTSTTTGTGAVTVSGVPPSTYQAFGTKFNAADITYYAIVHQTLNEWEVGIGTITGATSFARTTPLDGSAGVSTLVNFSAGTKDVWCDMAALGGVYEDNNNFTTLPVGQANVALGGFNAVFQVNGNGSNWIGTFSGWEATSGGPDFVFSKSRNATVGSHTIVQSADFIGSLWFYGDDGTNFQPAAAIRAQVDGTPGTSDMPGRLLFLTTPDDSATPVEAVRIDNNGCVVIGGAASRAGAFGTISLFQVQQAANFGPYIDLFATHDDTASPQIRQNKDRLGGSVQNGDDLGVFEFEGHDGTSLLQGAVIRAQVDGAPSTGQMPTRLIFYTSNFAGSASEAMRIDTRHRVVIGGTASLAVGGNENQVQNWGTDLATGAQTLGMFSATAANAAHLDFYRSKNGTLGSATVVASGDVLGELYFWGAQQTGTFATQNIGAKIQAAVDGTVTSGAGADMPGRLSILTTPDGSGTPAESIRASANGACAFPRLGTTATAANCFIDAASSPKYNMLESTSSLRVKTDISDVPDGRLLAALAMKPFEFRSLCPADDPVARFVGLGAEPVAEIDPTLVSWRRDNEDGPLVPSGVQYDRVNLLRTEALKLRCAELEEKNAALESRLAALEAKLQ